MSHHKETQRLCRFGIADLDFGCGLSLAKYSGDGDLDHDLGDYDYGDYGLGDHGDGDHVGIFVNRGLLTRS